MNESLDVWADMNDLDKTTPHTQAHQGDGVVEVDRSSALGRLFT